MFIVSIPIQSYFVDIVYFYIVNIRLLIILLVFATLGISAQTVRKVEIVNTDSLVFAESFGRNVKRLYGHVAFKHENVIMYCDSAYFYSVENEFDAFSNIHIKQSDTLNLYGDSLHFDGNKSLAQLQGAVKLVDKTTTLTTRNLDYDINTNIAYYYNGGKIVNIQNTLTSEIGTYFSQTKELFFKNKVVLVNAQYTINTDTLKYNTTSQIAYFFGPSTITSKNNLLYTENGWYNTKNETAEFYKKSYVSAGDRMVSGNKLQYDRKKGAGKAFGNVLIKDTTQNILLYGEVAHFTERPEFCFVTDSVLLIKAFAKDSLYLHCDTIVYQQFIPNGIDSLAYRMIKAYNKVRFFKPDMQGKCDSLVYDFRDSLVKMYTEPVIWAQSNQVSGTEVRLHVAKNEVDRVYIEDNAFIISQEGKESYNQVKGATMIGYIANNELYKLDVVRNGQTVYYMRDEQELVGISNAECEKITVLFEKAQISQITFLKKPTGVLYPPKQIAEEKKLLNDFSWKIGIRPMFKNDIFNWR